MLNKKNVNTTLKKSTKFITLLIIAFSSLTFSVFAEDNPLTAANIGGSSGPLATIYNFFLSISVPMAILGAAMCGLSFLISKEKGYEIARKRLFNIGIAIMVLMLIPSIFSMGAKTKNIGWNPSGGNVVIIPEAPNAGSGFDMNIGPTAPPSETDEEESP